MVALAIDIHYWCKEKMATCVSYETETDNSSSEIAGSPTRDLSSSGVYFDAEIKRSLEGLLGLTTSEKGSLFFPLVCSPGFGTY